VRKSWNRDLWWLHSINWKREGLSDAERYHQPFRYCFDDAACWQPPRRCTQKPLTVYQAPPDYGKGSWGCTVSDTALVLAKYIEHLEAHEPGRFEGKRVLELSADSGLAGLVLAAAGAKVQVSVQQEVKLKTVKRSCEQMEGAQMEAFHLPFAQVAADDDAKGSLPYELIVCSDEFLMFDSELAALALASLMRLSGSGSTVLIAFGRNANGAEEFLEEASEAFRVQKLDGEHLHPSFVGAPDDIKAYMLSRTDTIELTGREVQGGEVVPVSPHLSAKRGPRRGKIQFGGGYTGGGYAAQLFRQILRAEGTRRRDRHGFGRALAWMKHNLKSRKALKSLIDHGAVHM